MGLQSDLIRVVQRLSFCRDTDGVMAVLREATRELTGADGVTIVLREGNLCYYAEENAIAPLWKGRRFPMQSCISGWCMLHREQAAIPDIYADPRIPHDAYRPTFVQSLAMTPIRSEEPIGAIGAYWANHHQATAEELEVLQALGDTASTAFANVQLFEALQDANRRKDEFLSMLAHELRNPLAPIQNALHVLRLGTGDGAVRSRAQEMMERQVRHLTRIVDDLLDVSRIMRGKIRLQTERLDLAQVVRTTAEDYRAIFQQAGLTLDVDVPELAVWVTGDAIRLAQVLSNLLQNAAKFTDSGGKVGVRLRVDRANERAELSVSDTGIGIAPDMLPRLFESFNQADRSLDRSKGGLGLGLALVKGLVELHGGEVRAASAGPGRGTEISVRLPIAAEPAALSDAPTCSSHDGRHLRVLLVEDNHDSADTLRMLLELHHYEVAVAYTGPEGVTAAEKFRPDAVLCDIGLPGMDGFAVASALRRNAETATARLIAVTGYGREEDRRRALSAGFDAHLIKPVAPDKLLAELELPPGLLNHCRRT